MLDGVQGTGNGSEMALDERTTLAMDGIVIVAVDVFRPTSVMVQATGGEAASNRGQQLMGKVRITTRGMWVDEGRMLAQLHKVRLLQRPALPPSLPPCLPPSPQGACFSQLLNDVMQMHQAYMSCHAQCSTSGVVLRQKRLLQAIPFLAPPSSLFHFASHAEADCLCAQL